MLQGLGVIVFCLRRHTGLPCLLRGDATPYFGLTVFLATIGTVCALYLCKEVYQAKKIKRVRVQKLNRHYNCVGSIEIPNVLPLPQPKVLIQIRYLRNSLF